SLTVTLTNMPDGSAESLAADTTGTSITASYNALSGTLLLSGSDTRANYIKVLDTITYADSASLPNRTARIVTFIASDGTLTSNVPTSTVNINVLPPGLVDDINPGANSANLSWFANVNGTLFFAATDGTHGTELWKSDGTAAGTMMVADIFPGTSG